MNKKNSATAKHLKRNPSPPLLLCAERFPREEWSNLSPARKLELNEALLTERMIGRLPELAKYVDLFENVRWLRKNGTTEQFEARYKNFLREAKFFLPCFVGDVATCNSLMNKLSDEAILQMIKAEFRKRESGMDKTGLRYLSPKDGKGEELYEGTGGRDRGAFSRLAIDFFRAIRNSLEEWEKEKAHSKGDVYPISLSWNLPVKPAAATRTLLNGRFICNTDDPIVLRKKSQLIRRVGLRLRDCDIPVSLATEPYLTEGQINRRLSRA